MKTLVITGEDNLFKLSERHFDGIETHYEPISFLTNEEAWALARCHHFTLPGECQIGPTHLDPRELIKIEKEITIGLDGNEREIEHLYVCLSDLPNWLTRPQKILDPWFEEHRHLLKDPKWDTYRTDVFTDDTLVEEEEEWWPDNPAEAVAFW